MPRELLILRHAKSDRDGRFPSDFERPLARRGKEDAPQVGAWLYREGLIPDHVVSSPAERARQTALLVCKALELSKDRIQWDPQVYEAGVQDLLEVLGRCPPEAPLVLLVGHNPGLEDLIRHLCGDASDTPDDGKLMPTAALARLEMPDAWDRLGPGCAELLGIVRPRAL